MLEQKEMGSPRAPGKINAIELPENLKISLLHVQEDPRILLVH